MTIVGIGETVVTSRQCARQPLTSLVKFPDQTLFA
jgi:hypothetical protein